MWYAIFIWNKKPNNATALAVQKIPKSGDVIILIDFWPNIFVGGVAGGHVQVIAIELHGVKTLIEMTL